MPKPVSCHWTNGKALPGRNKYFYLMVTDKKALYLAAWYLTRPHWVFKICLRLLSPWLGVLFLPRIYFQQLGRYSTKVCSINCGWLVFYRTFWVLKISHRVPSTLGLVLKHQFEPKKGKHLTDPDLMPEPMWIGWHRSKVEHFWVDPMLKSNIGPGACSKIFSIDLSARVSI